MTVSEPSEVQGEVGLAGLIAESRKLLAAYDGAMASQSGNMADAKLIVMANYGDLCADLLRAIVNQNQPRFKWEIARTQAHLHCDGRFTGISFPIKSRHTEVDAWRDEVIAALGLPALLPSTRKDERA